MGKKKSNKGKGSYAAYAADSRAVKNRIAKLKRHLKKHPEDTQAAKALGVTKPHRTAPKTKGNFPKKKNYILDKSGKRTYTKYIK